MQYIFIGLLLVTMTGVGCKPRQHVEKIVVKGSDTEVNLVLQLAEAYMDTDPSVSISVTGGGSGVGIAALLNQRADIANASRELSADERDMAAKRGIGLQPLVFATDALAIVCHPSVPVDSLSLVDLGRIFSGEIADWSHFGAASRPISLYGRQSNSGTFMYFRERVVGKDYASSLKQMNGNAQILEAIKSDPNAIGYIGFGYLTDESGQLRSGIKVLGLMDRSTQRAISPLNTQQIEEGAYPLTRPLYQFIASAPTAKMAAFFEFERSAAGMAIIRKNGYLKPLQSYAALVDR